jgi:serine/threonine protein kinase
MPENYLHLARDVVDALGRAENNQPLQFNEIQCLLLKQKLQETATPLLSRVDKDSLPPEKQALFQQCCQGAALLELYRIVKLAEAIIHGCSTQDWLTAAIKLANSFEAFVDIHFKIDWCTAVVGIVFSNAVSSELQHVGENIPGFGENECALKMEEIRSMLQQPATQDRDSLGRRLTEMQGDRRNKNKEEIIAYLLKLVTTDPANMEPTTVDLLPTIERKNLRYVRTIGKGGFGEVAEVVWLGQKVAQKIFLGFESSSFLLESNILAGLSHPNIVQIFGVCTGGRQCSIVMELMDRDLLRAIINAFNRSTSTSDHREQSFTLPVALDIMLQMAEAMQYLHRKKITHRDLKSANMLINPAQIPEIAEAGYVDVKVADFGISKIINGTTTTSPQTRRIGTTRWMAPEVMSEPEKDSSKMKFYPLKSDVYSYAMTCYEILSGRLPFEGLCPLSKLEENVRAGLRPSLPDSLPTSLSSLIERCWDGDVRRRPSFSRISTELRHLKGIYLISGKYSRN